MERSPPVPRIPFLSVRIPDEMPDTHAVERRLKDFLERIRRDADPDAEKDAEDGHDDRPYAIHARLDREDRLRIARRAKAYVTRVRAATGLEHLAQDDRQKLAILRDGATVMAVPSAHRADEIAAALHDDMPWMAPATEIVWKAMRASVRHGSLGLQLPPMLLVGPPGIGKSRWARRLAQEIGLPVCAIEATGEPAGFAISGSQRGWSTAGPGKPVQTVLRTACANPLVIVDEVEKAGEVSDRKGRRHDLTDALLPLLERSSAATWPCPYFQIPFDMTWMSWVLTANTTRGLSEPILNRCPPLRLPALTRDQLVGFAVREARRRDLPDDVRDAVLSILSEDWGFRPPSLRTVIRMIERAEGVADMPALH